MTYFLIALIFIVPMVIAYFSMKKADSSKSKDKFSKMTESILNDKDFIESLNNPVRTPKEKQINPKSYSTSASVSGGSVPKTGVVTSANSSDNDTGLTSAIVVSSMVNAASTTENSSHSPTIHSNSYSSPSSSSYSSHCSGSDSSSSSGSDSGSCGGD